MATVALDVALKEVLVVAATTFAEAALTSALTPDTGRLSNTFVTGSSYTTPLPYVFGQIRADAQVIWALQLHKHTKSGHYQATFASLYGYMPQVTSGAAEGGLVLKIFFNGILHWDSSVLYDTVHVGWFTTSNRADPPLETWGGNQTAASTFMTSRSPGAASSVAYLGFSGSVFDALNAFVYGNQIPPLHSAIVDGGHLTLGGFLRLCLSIQGLDPSTQGDFSDVDGILINQSFTRVVAGTSSSTQEVVSTEGMQVGDNVAFGSTGVTTTIASVVDSTHITLAASVTTTTGMPVYNGGTSSHFPVFGGIRFDSGGNWGDLMQSVCDFYLVDLLESEGKIKARRRIADTADFVIDWHDMGAIEYDGTKDPEVRIVETIAYPMDLPARVNFSYTNSNDNHLSGLVTATREGAIGTNTVDKNYDFIACSADQALNAAQGWLDEQYIQQRSFEFTLGQKYYGIEPGDILDVPLDGSDTPEVVRVRVREIQDRNPQGIFKVVCVRCSSSSFTQGSSGTSGSGTGGGSGSGNVIVAPTGVVWSGPEAYPADPLAARPCFEVVGDWPAGDNRSGLDVWYVPDGGTDLVFGGNINNTTPIGHTTSAMPDGVTVGDFETRSTPLVMDQSGDDLPIVSEDEAKAGSNYCLVLKSDGSGELLNIAVFTKTSDSHFTATDMTGGLNGSSMTAHGTTDAFAALSLGEVLRVNFAPAIEQSQIGKTIPVTLVPYGQDPAGALAVTYNVTIAAPGANASAPDSVTVSGPVWWHQDVYRFCRADYSADFSTSGTIFKWETNLSGAGWVTLSQTGALVFVAWPPGDTMEIRVTAIAANGSTAGPVATSNLGYIEPHILGWLNPVTVVDTVTDYEGSGWTLSGNFLIAPSNGALAAIDGYSSWSVGSPGSLPSRILLCKPGGHKWNGCWDVAQVGDSTHPTKLTRSAQSQQVTDYIKSQVVAIQEGTAYGGSLWMETGTEPGTINVDPIQYQFVGGIGVATTGDLADYLKKDGSVAMTGALDMGTHKIVDVVDPTSAQDAATKNYVDTHGGGALSIQTITGDGSTAAWAVTGSYTTLLVFLNGQLLVSGLSNGPSYSISGGNITFLQQGSSHTLQAGGDAQEYALLIKQ